MARELSFGDAAGWFGLQDMYSAAQTASADNSFTRPRTSDTVTTNAIDGAAPIDNSGGGSWGDFWQGGIKAALGYAIAKDVAKSGAAAPRGAGGMAAPQPAAAAPSWLLPVAVVGAGLVAVLMLKSK